MLYHKPELVSALLLLVAEGLEKVGVHLAAGYKLLDEPRTDSMLDSGFFVAQLQLTNRLDDLTQIFGAKLALLSA